MGKSTAQLKKELSVLRNKQQKTNLKRKIAFAKVQEKKRVKQEIRNLKHGKKIRFAKGTGKVVGSLALRGTKGVFKFVDKLTAPPKRRGR
tara:strand:+ start:234 stop:503 length:270 start_codon:yes stop_codon:yes gene_type:complete